MGLRRFLACCLAAGVVATVGGALFDVLHGGTTLTRSIAYGFWIAAAFALVLMALAASKRLARRFDLPFIEGWVFLSAAILLTAAGIVVDLLGSG
jgi:Na+-translocating ferredoxin:NAD+ oxidoreductase RnfA subunit